MSFEGRLSVSNSHSFLIEAEELLSDHTSHLIIEARYEEHYAAGHISGAIHFCTYDQFVRSTSPIGLSRFQSSMAGTYCKIGVDPHKSVVVCDEKTGMRAARDCWMLQYMGHPNVRILHGGGGGGGSMAAKKWRSGYRADIPRFYDFRLYSKG